MSNVWVAVLIYNSLKLGSRIYQLSLRSTTSRQISSSVNTTGGMFSTTLKHNHNMCTIHIWQSNSVSVFVFAFCAKCTFVLGQLFTRDAKMYWCCSNVIKEETLLLSQMSVKISQRATVHSLSQCFWSAWCLDSFCTTESASGHKNLFQITPTKVFWPNL